MRIHRLLITLIATASVFGSPLLARADDGGPPPLPRKEFCKENPGKCEEAKARRKQYCQTNPDKCKAMRDKRAERREFCQKNPEKCKEQRENMQSRRAEMQAKCAADPAKCDEMKEQGRKRMRDHMGSGQNPAPASPSPAK